MNFRSLTVFCMCSWTHKQAKTQRCHCWRRRRLRDLNSHRLDFLPLPLDEKSKEDDALSKTTDHDLTASHGPNNVQPMLHQTEWRYVAAGFKRNSGCIVLYKVTPFMVKILRHLAATIKEHRLCTQSGRFGGLSWG
jgi:hypothetical protein